MIFSRDSSWLSEEITVNMQNVSLRQALLNIVNTVDGEIDAGVDDNSIEIQGPTRRAPKPVVPAKTKSSAGTSDGYVGKISIPMEGGKYYIEFMLREGDLTEELKKLREEKIKEIIEKSEESD